MGLRAQVQIGGKSSRVRVELELMPLQFIQIGDGEKDGEPGDAVDLLYSSSDAYTDSVARRVGGRLRAVSADGSGGYTVSAILRGDFQKEADKGADGLAAEEPLPLASPMRPETERSDVASRRSDTDAEGNRELDLMYSIAPN